MNTIRRLTLVAIGILATGLAYLAAPLWALASQGLSNDGGGTPPPVTTTTIERHGSPLWQFGAVAVVATLITAAVLIGYDRIHDHRVQAV